MYQFAYELWHAKIGCDDELETDDQEAAPRRIGLYSTEANAQAAIDRLKDKPGFRDSPAGFRILRAPLNKISWETGFISWEDA